LTDGPFAEANEAIGGYWITQVRSCEEAIKWFRRAPIANNDMIEVRQIFDMPEPPEDDQKAAEGFELPALRAMHLDPNTTLQSE
jgi:hypothetical protein